MSLQAGILKIFMAMMMSHIAKASSIKAQIARFEKIIGMTKLAKDVEVKPLQVEGIPVEWITTLQTDPDQVILYLHSCPVDKSRTEAMAA
jgi:hypothetical protein